mgnify:CR=1 FL=1
MQNLRFKIKCANCNSIMEFDDRDFKFIGNYDNYYSCPSCECGCIMQVRYNKPVNLDYYNEDDGFEKHVNTSNIHEYVEDKQQGSEFD